MSAPKSGKMVAAIHALSEEMLRVILGAGSVAVTLRMVERSDRALASIDVGVVSGCCGLPQHTLAKRPNLPQMLQDRPKTGHRDRPPR